MSLLLVLLNNPPRIGKSPSSGTFEPPLPWLSFNIPPKIIVLPSGTVTIVSTLLSVVSGGYKPVFEARSKSDRVKLISRRSKLLSLICGIIESVIPAS